MARLGRPPKPRESIPTPEQVAEIQSKGLTPAQQGAQERRRKDAERKRLERQKARAEKEIENIESYEQLWEHNRTMLSESELSVRAKDQRTRDLWNWLDLVLERLRHQSRPRLADDGIRDSRSGGSRP
jgi:hypothetical protein